MQTEVIETLDTFVMFKQKFDHFFNSCEKGFRNEFIMQMYTREFPAGQEIIAYGKKFREIFFITLGAVNLYTKDENLFMQLPEGSIFGDYQVFYELNSNMIIKTFSDDEMSIPLSKFMGCERGVVEELCELYPKTAENLKQRALEKRHVYMHYMRKVLIPPS